MDSSKAFTLHRSIKCWAKLPWEVVSDCSLKYYNQFFLAERDIRGWRTATDLSTPNTFVSQTKVRMEKVMDVLVSV